MLDRDLKESRSKIIVVNRSNKVRSSLLKEPKRVNHGVGRCTAGVDAWEVFGILRGDVSSKNVVE
jgi:hypothetical protein